MKTVTFILLLFLGIFCANAQNIPWDDLQKVNDVFLSAPTYFIKSSYTLYKENESTPIESFNAVVKKKGEAMYYKLGESEIFVRGKKQFMIQHDEKTAVLNTDYLGEDGDITPQSVKLKIEVLKKTANLIKYSAEGNDIGIFKCYGYDKNKPLMEFYYNRKSFYLTKMVIYKTYNIVRNGVNITENYRLIIDYNSIDLTGKGIADTDFLYSKYLTESDGKFALKTGYKNYKLAIN
jgi:hypothetical protein